MARIGTVPCIAGSGNFWDHFEDSALQDREPAGTILNALARRTPLSGAHRAWPPEGVGVPTHTHTKHARRETDTRTIRTHTHTNTHECTRTHAHTHAHAAACCSSHDAAPTWRRGLAQAQSATLMHNQFSDVMVATSLATSPEVTWEHRRFGHHMGRCPDGNSDSNFGR